MKNYQNSGKFSHGALFYGSKCKAKIKMGRKTGVMIQLYLCKRQLQKLYTEVQMAMKKHRNRQQLQLSLSSRFVKFLDILLCDNWNKYWLKFWDCPSYTVTLWQAHMWQKRISCGHVALKSQITVKVKDFRNIGRKNIWRSSLKLSYYIWQLGKGSPYV